MALQISHMAAVAVLSFALTACSSSDGDGDGDSGTGGTADGTSSAGSTDGSSTTGSTDSGTTDSGSTGGTSSSDTRAIAGLWDFSDDYGSGVIDVYYFEVSPDGLGTDWDYDGDSFDQGDNCYFKSSYPIVNLGNNQYEFDGGIVTATVANGVLTVQSAELGTIQLPALTGISSADFNECSFI